MNTRVVVHDQLAAAIEPRRLSNWLYIRQPFEALPSDEDIAALGLPIQNTVLATVKIHVEQRKADQAAAPDSFRDSFDVPYALEIRQDGSLAAIYEAQQEWFEIIEGLEAVATP